MALTLDQVATACIEAGTKSAELETGMLIAAAVVFVFIYVMWIISYVKYSRIKTWLREKGYYTEYLEHEVEIKKWR